MCGEKRWGLLFLQKMVVTPATKMMTPETMMTVSWWRASRTRPGETILNFLCANMRQAYFKAIYLQEHHSPHMVNDFTLTTISVIFLMQHHISLIKCCRPSNSRVKGKSPPTTNNPWTKAAHTTLKDSKTLKKFCIIQTLASLAMPFFGPAPAHTVNTSSCSMSSSK